MSEHTVSRAFPGLHFFEDTPRDQALFFGREQEIRELTNRVIAEDITILFGKSGNGKTSLISAGIKNRLREKGFFPVHARIFNLIGKQDPIKKLYSEIKIEARSQSVDLSASSKWEKETLWEALYRLEPILERQSRQMVIILDQFEELFTLMANKNKDQQYFIDQLADVIRSRSPEALKAKYSEGLKEENQTQASRSDAETILYNKFEFRTRILISIREDHLAALDKLGDKIPTIYQSRFRLKRLREVQAREAIMLPPGQDVLGTKKFEITRNAADNILVFLVGHSNDPTRKDKVIEPSLLQIVCRQLEENMRASDGKLIDKKAVGGRQFKEKLIYNFYESIVKDFPLLRFGSGKDSKGLLHSPYRRIRRLTEHGLITVSGYRNNLHEDEIIHKLGVPKSDIEKLVQSRIIRRDERSSSTFYELSHDVLVAPLKNRRDKSAKTFRLLLKAVILIFVAAPILLYTWTRNKSKIILEEKTSVLSGELKSLKNNEISLAYFEKKLHDFEKENPAESLKGVKTDYKKHESKIDSIRNIILTSSPDLNDSTFLRYKGLFPAEPSIQLPIDSIFAIKQTILQNTVDSVVTMAEELAKKNISHSKNSPSLATPEQERVDDLSTVLLPIKIVTDSSSIIRPFAPEHGQTVDPLNRVTYRVDVPKIIGGDEELDKYLKYPEHLRKTYTTCELTLEATIGLDGKASNIKIVTSNCPDIDYSKVAIEAFKAVNWMPAIQDDKPIAIRVSRVIKFQINPFR